MWDKRWMDFYKKGMVCVKRAWVDHGFVMLVDV